MTWMMIQMATKKKTITILSEDYLEHKKLAERVFNVVENRFQNDSKCFILDSKGHSSTDRGVKQNLTYIKMWSLLGFTKEELLKIEAGEKVNPQPIPFSEGECWYCGDHYGVHFDGVNIFANEECKYPGGIAEYNFELNVPSGKMVFANDLRMWFQNHFDFNVNSDIGKLKTTESYAKVGMAHAFVGNSCPSIHQVDEVTLSISGRAYEKGDSAYDAEVDDWVELTKDQAEALSPLGKEVGSICTDLWWYSVVDYDDFSRRFLEKGSKKEFLKYIKTSCDVVSVKPGVYKFTHHEDRRESVKTMKPFHYAEIVWDRDPDSKDLYAEYKKVNYTIGQCLLADRINRSRYFEERKNLTIEQQIERYQSLTPEALEELTARFYSDIFCSFDRGSWHPMGWSSSHEIPEVLPEFPLPPLTKKHRWSDMNKEYCGLYLASTGNDSYLGYNIPTLNESFLTAAYEMCYSILKFGADGFKTSEEDPKSEKAKQKLALMSLKNLDARFPGTLPEKCKEFL
jgi:hypothetical protein